MAKFEIGVKSEQTRNIYFTGMTVIADNRDKAIDSYLTQSHDNVSRSLVYANEV